jgi:carbonic anhydrase
MSRKVIMFGVIGLLGVIGGATAWATNDSTPDQQHAATSHDAIQAPADPAPTHMAAAATAHGAAGKHAAPAGHGDHPWAYEGQKGPDKWGALKADYEACAVGHEQSPIDLTGGVDAEIANISLHWTPADWKVQNNGHTIQAQGDNGGYALIDGERFDLLQFHFHTPSEHTIDGKHYPMEVHFVHKNAEGRLAVIGVMLMGGGANPLFSQIMAQAPQGEGEARLGQIDQRGLVSPINGIYRYQGSLTTPPCSETVLWTVLTIPLMVAQPDIEKFTQMFPMNARPLQPLHRRYLLRD